MTQVSGTSRGEPDRVEPSAPSRDERAYPKGIGHASAARCNTSVSKHLAHKRPVALNEVLMRPRHEGALKLVLMRATNELQIYLSSSHYHSHARSRARGSSHY